MDYDYFLEHNGYGKLAEKLPETGKNFLEGFQWAIDSLKNFKNNIDDYIETDIKSIAKMEQEIAECTIDNAVFELETEKKGITISFVDNNHYSIDDDGKIYDDDTDEEVKE